MLAIKRILRPYIQVIRYVFRGFDDPSPNWSKWRVLARHFASNGTCVETGTYLGETTAFLARRYPKVYSLEPYGPLFIAAEKRFKASEHVTILNQSSEEGFEELVSKLRGPVNFWLDGHYSGNGTFLSDDISPIEHELNVIGNALPNLDAVRIAIDDFRLFKDDGSEGYPPPKLLVDFATRCKFHWTIEKDIFLLMRTETD